MPEARLWRSSPPRPGCRRSASAAHWAGWRPASRPRPAAALSVAGSVPSRTRSVSRTRTGSSKKSGCWCCRTRCPATPSGHWPGSACSARALSRCSRPGAVPAGRAAAGPARAGRHRADRGSAGGLRPAQERLLRAGRDAADAGVPGAGRGTPRRGRDPHPACGAGPGAGPGPGAGGQDDIRRKLGELAAAGKAHELVMALAHRHAAAKPDALGFLYADGHARAYYGTRRVQKTHVARLKFPAPATMETWVTDSGGDPVLMVVAEPSESLAAEIKRLLPQLRQVVGEGREVTVCSGRGGWSPAVFADIIEAGFDLLTWRKGPPAPDVPAAKFTTVTCTDDRGRQREYDLADTPVELPITDGPRKGETVSLRQVTRRVPARRGATAGATRQIHALATRKDLNAAEVCWRLSGRWREENYFRYARTWFAPAALDSHAASPD